MKIVGLISGGKDSCFNLIKCVNYGHSILALAHLRPSTGDEMDSFMYQTVGSECIEGIAKAMNLPLFIRNIDGACKKDSMVYQETKGDEVEDLFELLKEVKEKIPEIEGVSSGAILSNYQRYRVENV
jgi:diphthine-ammonia ligase